MIRAIGIDLSLAATGVALDDGRCSTCRPHAGSDDPARRLHEIVDHIAARTRDRHIEIAVIEGYNPRGVQGFTMARLGEIGGAVRVLLHELVIPYIEIAPKSLKLFAAGSGDATKQHMVNAARALGADVANDNEADAFWLRMAALQRYEPRADGPKLTKSIAALPWPQLRTRVA